MANAFDQFDAPAAATPRANPFDQFDQPAAPALAGAVEDVAKSLPVGVAKGAIGLVGLPGTIQQAGNSLVDRIMLGVGHKAMDWTGLGPQAGTPDRAAFDELYNGIGHASSVPSGADIQRGAEKVTGPFRKPQTTPGHYADTVGEFAPSLLLGSGGIVPRVIGDWLIPAIMSEGAGQATKGTKAEPIARLAGGLAGNVGSTVARARTAAPERLVADATRGVTQVEFDAAQALQSRAARAGVPLSGPEAIQAVTSGATKLGDVQRVVEGSTVGGAATSRFYAERPQQVNAAATRTLDTIAPQDATPSTLGPRVAASAKAIQQDQIAASPEGKAFNEAVWRAGPRTTPEEAGAIIQPGVAESYARREGMRNALADGDYSRARNAAPELDTTFMEPGTFSTPTRTVHTYDDIAGGYTQRPSRPPSDTPPLVSNGPGPLVQLDPREAVRAIDNELGAAKGSTRDALVQARSLLFSGKALDTTVEGVDNARKQLGTMINAAVRNGDTPTASVLSKVLSHIDDTLSDVPQYAKAKANFQAASAPVEHIETTPALSKTVERDPYNTRFVTPAEKVPGMIEQGGPTASRAFNETAPGEAHRTFQGYLTTKFLDSATDASGKISPDVLTIVMRENKDLLAQHPEVEKRLTDIVTAHKALPAPEQGPLGRVAGVKDTAGATDAVLPRQPLVGGEHELVDTIMRLGKRDPDTTTALVRQALADRFDQTAGRLVGGENQYGGARFAKDIAGTPQAETNLHAVVGATPNGPTAQPAVSDLVDILRATGMRKPQGSATEFNRQINSELSAPPLAATGLAGAKTLGLAAATQVGDNMRRAWLGRGTNSLAGLFLAPDSADQIRRLAARRAQTPAADAALRQLMQTDGELRRP
jgi:hypothetical protein